MHGCVPPRLRGARVAASVAVLLLASGCASRHVTASASASAPAYASASAPTSTPPGCAPPKGPSPPGGSDAAVRYLAIATAGNQRLEIDFDRLEGPDRGRLAAAQADLRDIAATERQFDRCLVAIVFPPRTEAVVETLFAVNEARADLTATAAGADSLSRLAGYEKQLTAANVPVENAVTVIRGQLGLPPPATS